METQDNLPYDEVLALVDAFQEAMTSLTRSIRELLDRLIEVRGGDYRKPISTKTATIQCPFSVDRLTQSLSILPSIQMTTSGCATFTVAKLHALVVASATYSDAIVAYGHPYWSNLRQNILDLSVEPSTRCLLTSIWTSTICRHLSTETAPRELGLTRKPGPLALVSRIVLCAARCAASRRHSAILTFVRLHHQQHYIKIGKTTMRQASAW